VETRARGAHVSSMLDTLPVGSSHEGAYRHDVVPQRRYVSTTDYFFSSAIVMSRYHASLGGPLWICKQITPLSAIVESVST
jgi:hypothetical protein